MWLKTPPRPTAIAWDGLLFPSAEHSDEVADYAVRGKYSRDIEKNIREYLPEASIGCPEIYPIEQLIPVDEMPLQMHLLAESDIFFLVRFFCSFRPRGRNSNLAWARFQAELLPDEAGRQPIAYDLHPRLVTMEVKHSQNATLNPSLKFQDIEVSAGSFGFGIEYAVLEPLVSAAGIGEATPSWDYEAPHGQRLVGSKWMHLVLRAPRDIAECRVRLDLLADLEFSGLKVPLLRGRRSDHRLELTLWPSSHSGD